MNRKFQPQNYNKKEMIKMRREGSPWVRNLHYKMRYTYEPVGWSRHQSQFARRFARLHYLACHAPEPVALKWRRAYNMFYKKYFGSHMASVRFANNHTAHSWL
jgi:hypothetical protein